MSAPVKLRNVRLAFNDLHEAVQYQGTGPFRYNGQFLIEKGSDNDKAIWAAIKEATVAEWGKKADAMVESMKGNNNKFCYVSGDNSTYESHKGMMILSSHRRQLDGPPGLVDVDGKTILTPSSGKPYSGCYVYANVDLWAQSGQNSGVRCGLVSVQFFRHGDAFSGARSVNPDDFEDLGDGAAAEEESLVD